jgi:hypothetical protein
LRRERRLHLIFLALVIAVAGALGCHRPPQGTATPAAGSALGGFQALYQAHVEGVGASRSLRLAVAVGDDDRFRLEVLGPVGGARLAIAFDGSHLRAVFPGERLCGEWQDTAAALREMTGIALPAPQWLALLLGRLTAGDLMQYAFQIETVTNGRVMRAQLAADGPGGVGAPPTVSYTEFRPAPGGELAAEVRIQRGAEGITLTLRQLHPIPPPVEALALPCPPGFGAAAAEAFSAAGVSFLGEER